LNNPKNQKEKVSFLGEKEKRPKGVFRGGPRGGYTHKNAIYNGRANERRRA